MQKIWLVSYFVLILLFAVFSFVLADPNLFLWRGDWFITAQTWLWQNILPVQNLRTGLGAGLLLLLFANYLLLLNNFPQQLLGQRRNFWLFLVGLSLPLILTYNAFSYDLFNYIFNAKMVLDFGANPHLRVAQEFADEPMLRFMNNVHTVAPYGYGWTALSLLPYSLAGGKFLLTFLTFKIFAALSLLLTLLVAEKICNQQQLKNKYQQLAWFFLNPLLLIEVLGSGHNDLFMMLPALLAIYLTISHYRGQWWKILGVLLLITLSASIKFATLVLLPFFLYWPLRHRLPQISHHFDWLALAMFVPLLTERSKQFLPWYLLWSLVFVPWMRLTWWRNLLIAFSLAALLRYLPWLYYLPWMSFHLDTSRLLDYQKLVTWVIPGIYLLASFLIARLNPRHAK